MNRGVLCGYKTRNTPVFIGINGSTNGDCNVPSGAIAGDLAIAAITHNNSGTTLPTGWYSSFNQLIIPASGFDFAVVFWKRLTATDPGTTVSFGSQLSSISVYRGCADPVIVTSDYVSSGTLVTSEIATREPGKTIFRAVSMVDGGGGTTAPAFSYSNSRTTQVRAYWGLGVSDYIPSGSVPAETITSSTSDIMRCNTLLLTGSGF